MRLATSKQAIRLLLIIGIVTNGAGSCIVNKLRKLSEVIVGVCTGRCCRSAKFSTHAKVLGKF